MFGVDIQNYPSYTGGEHMFRKIMGKRPESETYSLNAVDRVKIDLKLYRIRQVTVKMTSDIAFKSPREATCSSNTCICDDF